jgi:hypothetical protein
MNASVDQSSFNSDIKLEEEQKKLKMEKVQVEFKKEIDTQVGTVHLLIKTKPGLQFPKSTFMCQLGKWGKNFSFLNKKISFSNLSDRITWDKKHDRSKWSICDLYSLYFILLVEINLLFICI